MKQTNKHTQQQPVLLMENHNIDYIPQWMTHKFWEYNIHPITGKRCSLRINHSSKIDATSHQRRETHNEFKTRHI